MDPQSLLDFLSRSTFQIASHILRQTPYRLHARIDPARLLNAFQFQLESGEVLRPTPWKHTPSGDIHDADDQDRGHVEKTAHQEIVEHFTKVYFPKMAQAIPTIPNEYRFPKDKRGRESEFSTILYRFGFTKWHSGGVKRLGSPSENSSRAKRKCDLNYL